MSHTHSMDDMINKHTHHEMSHTHPGDELHAGEDLSHIHAKDDPNHDIFHKDDGITHEEGIAHEVMHHEGELSHKLTHQPDDMGHEHVMDKGEQGSSISPSGPESADFDFGRSSVLESNPIERTVVSVSSDSRPATMVHIQSSESEHINTPATADTFGTVSENGNVPPLFGGLGFRPNEALEIHTEISDTAQPAVSDDPPAELFSPAKEEVPVLPPEEPTATEVAPTGSCRPRQLDMCSDLPYTLTSLPNWANDQSEQDLNEASLPFLRDVIVRSGCSPRARQYTCGILEPPCKSDGSIVPPCRTFCRSVAVTCQEFIFSGLNLSNIFDCERFPDSNDPEVCFDMTQEPCVGLEHRCGDGRCVARRLVCDGLPDCLDHSDETTCPNRDSGFSDAPSSTSSAVPASVESQTIFSGELDTGVTTSPEEIFESATTESVVETTDFGIQCPELQCLDGTCLSISQLNDGVNDCSDGTDELDFGNLS
ncbi:hypothetical protein SK128_006194 [Halocaridina rubra]|uniref:FZ domain-containing protein n=1 Tax=Halocaridina rubra TaxID=373956 RepID=A0AAN8XNA1_HALRR